jgi:gliding motility-associated-like protein
MDTGCNNVGSFRLIVYPLSDINMDDTYKFCLGQSIQIDAPSGFDAYNWSTGETTQDIVVNTAGDYTLTVTDHHGCTNSKVIRVVASDIAIIDDVEINDFNTIGDNSIKIKASGIGDYEYSIDGMNYQDENIITGLYPGSYTVYVSDKNGCGLVTKDIDILGAPQYFTPNGDGFNDTWQIMNIGKKPETTVQIFNRYGKLVKTLNAADNGWDGNFNGKPLPADDYWFRVIIKDHNGKTRQVKGHFTLKR